MMKCSLTNSVEVALDSCCGVCHTCWPSSVQVFLYYYYRNGLVRIIGEVFLYGSWISLYTRLTDRWRPVLLHLLDKQSFDAAGEAFPY